MEQISMFETLQVSLDISGTDIPIVNEEGYISADKLIPAKWEAWKYSNSKWTLRDGEPYVIDAFVAILPGNCVYVKEWVCYPFMHECKTAREAENMYYALRAKIVEREKRNNEIQKTWKTNILPPLEDMWEYKDGEYSCKEYAKKALYGYRI